jgi:hypothetical protein
MIEAGTEKDWEAFVYGQMRMYGHHIECMYGLPDANTTSAKYKEVFKTPERKVSDPIQETTTVKRIVFACETMAFGKFSTRVWVRQE